MLPPAVHAEPKQLCSSAETPSQNKEPQRSSAKTRSAPATPRRESQTGAQSKSVAAPPTGSTTGGSMRFPVAKLPVHVYLVINLITSIRTAKLTLASEVAQSRSSCLIWPLIQLNYFTGPFYYNFFFFLSPILHPVASFDSFKQFL